MKIKDSSDYMDPVREEYLNQDRMSGDRLYKRGTYKLKESEYRLF